MKKRRIIIVLLSLFLFPLGYALATKPPDPLNYYALRRAHGQSEAILAEYRLVRSDMADSGYWKMGDVSGQFYNFLDGERIVVGGDRAIHTLWIFGNSGVADVFLADKDTAAQYLQWHLPAYRVRNRGACFQAEAGELAYLRETPVRAGDLVLFIDGQNNTPNIATIIAQAEAYTRQRGAALVHFRQPYIDNSLDEKPGIPLYVPSQYVVDTSHLDETGAAIEARQIYNWLTIY